MNRLQIIVAGGLVATLIVGISVGSFVAHRSDSLRNTSVIGAPQKVAYWVAPMDASYRRDKPGKSPMGMDLIPVYADSDDGLLPSDVEISPTVVNELGVRTALVQQGVFTHQIEAVGYVGYDEDLVSTINSRADGWIEKLYVKVEGESVREGQPLYELFSPKLATAESEYLTALSSGMPSLVRASQERLAALGFSQDQIRNLVKDRRTSNRVVRSADRGGIVTKLDVSEGAYVTPSTRVMKISDLSKVWMLVEVDQSDASALEIGQTAVSEFDAFPRKKWTGVVDYIYPDINSTTRTAKIRLKFDNPDRKLQPNMYAHVAIGTTPRSNAVYIPSSALIQTGRSQRVAVALGNGRFDICPVVAGAESDNTVEILKGLVAGQTVVVSSQFLIDSEANLDAAALRMGANRPGCSEQQTTTIKAPVPSAITKPRQDDIPSMDVVPNMKDMPNMDMSTGKETRP